MDIITQRRSLVTFQGLRLFCELMLPININYKYVTAFAFPVHVQLLRVPELTAFLTKKNPFILLYQYIATC